MLELAVDRRLALKKRTGQGITARTDFVVVLLWPERVRYVLEKKRAGRKDSLKLLSYIPLSVVALIERADEIVENRSISSAQQSRGKENAVGDRIGEW